MDEGKIMIHEDRRKARTKDVILEFVTRNNFNVLDEEGNMKYSGSINPPNCECQSFIHNNTERYESSHPEPFLCKHIFRAIESPLKKYKEKLSQRGTFVGPK